jgi:DNA-binding SARP family transcriptional activator
MIELRTLGTLSLRASDGREVDSLLAHSKRAGLLVYLSTARPRGFHRRDALLALFWPELDQERARTSLRKAIFQIRRSLGDEVIVGRGDEELRVADHLVWCDARALDEALDSGDAEGAIALYEGRFLDAFFVPEALGFERWMDEERSRLNGRAFDAAWQLAVRDEQAGNAFGAASWARRAAALAPHDECAVRRLIELLDRQGDRAGCGDASARSIAARSSGELDGARAPGAGSAYHHYRRRARTPCRRGARDGRPGARAHTGDA